MRIQEHEDKFNDTVHISSPIVELHIQLYLPFNNNVLANILQISNMTTTCYCNPLRWHGDASLQLKSITSLTSQNTTRKNCGRINIKSTENRWSGLLFRSRWPGQTSTEGFWSIYVDLVTNNNNNNSKYHCPHFLGKIFFYCADFSVKTITSGCSDFYRTLALPAYACKARLG